jgi:ribokinase
MIITNFGSYCIDHVYCVPYFVKPGETLPSTSYEVHPGGKGLNQSLALAYAGAKVRHAGKIGRDGRWMRALLGDAGVDTTLTSVVDTPTGHANIQVTPEGENAIIICGGANKEISGGDIENALSGVSDGDHLLIQNEISCLPELLEIAASRKQRVTFNAAPMTADVKAYPLDLVETFIVNEVEGEALTGETTTENILDSMIDLYPSARVILTLGDKGAVFQDRKERIRQSAISVKAVDSTGAGDTFTGYFLANFINRTGISDCLEIACRAAGICVTRQGAASSIPKLAEL